MEVLAGLTYEAAGEMGKAQEVYAAFVRDYTSLVREDGSVRDLVVLAMTKLGLKPPAGAVAVSNGLAPPDDPSGQVAFEQITPNPSNPRTTLSFTLPQAAEVTLVIYNTLGQAVRTLTDCSRLPAGRQQVVWDGRDDTHRAVASGVYLARLTAAGQVATQKVVFLK